MKMTTSARGLGVALLCGFAVLAAAPEARAQSLLGIDSGAGEAVTPPPLATPAPTPVPVGQSVDGWSVVMNAIRAMLPSAMPRTPSGNWHYNGFMPWWTPPVR